MHLSCIQENFYALLENEALKVNERDEVKSSDPSKKDCQEPTKNSSSPPCNNVVTGINAMNSTKESEESESLSSTSQSLAVPLYAVPNKVKSRTNEVW